MERRRNYLGIASRPSLSKFSSSLATKDISRAMTTSKFSKASHKLNVSKYSKPSPSRTSQHTTHYIAHKRSTKMSAPIKTNPLKRPHEEDDTRPFKKPEIEPTGLEHYQVMKDITNRMASPATASQEGLYVRRRKIIYIDVLKKKRAMASKVRGDWGSMPAPAQKGMRNLTGAICYRLSLLQALLHQPRFVNFIRESHLPEHCVADSTDRCVTCVLRLLILEYWGGSQDLSRTSKVLKVMDTLFTTLGWAPDVASGHADPDEQIAWIWETMSAELQTPTLSCLEAILQPGQITAICCSRCGHETRSAYHRDTIIAVGIARTINGRNGTLAQYLQRYMVEELDDYRCDGCQDRVSTKYRKQLINYGPEILMVELKRTNAYGMKINTHVAINTMLDLSAYRDASNQDHMKYELSGVVKHRGTTAGGHYVCFTKGPDGRWVEFDDHHKYSTTLKEAVGSQGGFTPYILFFQRKGE